MKKERKGEMEIEVEMGGPDSQNKHVMLAFLSLFPFFLSLSSQTLITPFFFLLEFAANGGFESTVGTDGGGFQGQQ